MARSLALGFSRCIHRSCREEPANFSCIAELLEVEQSIFELLDTRTGKDAGSEEAEFLQYLVASHGVFVAAFCMEYFLAVVLTVMQLHLEVDAVAPFVSQGFELVVFNHFYFSSGLQDRFASNGLLRDLVDEKVAVVQQSSDTERADSSAPWSCSLVHRTNRREAW